MSSESVIKVGHVCKNYGPVQAVNDVSFSVQKGEIFGMVGPNGAGKTTAIECMEGLRSIDRGNITVLGCDPHKDRYHLRSRMGVQLQESELPHRIKVREALELFASFYPHSVDWHHLVKELDLETHLDMVFKNLSGGQKQRLFIALTLINDPELIFLDELTTGLDPQARRKMWALVKEIRDQGKTVFLTTHFMEEAERLCDRVAVMDKGKMVSMDSPENLIHQLGAEHRVIFTCEDNKTIPKDTIEELESVVRIEINGEQMVVYGKGENIVVDVVNQLTKNNIPFRDLRTEQPNLEDVFLTLTGREIRE